ncbi:Aldehyde dehydrogenase [Anoxybacillus sp. BCO1]|nr:Aldehyde dehydrogenase [Anoxybacillus sp. BCO1]
MVIYTLQEIEAFLNEFLCPIFRYYTNLPVNSLVGRYSVETIMRENRPIGEVLVELSGCDHETAKQIITSQEMSEPLYRFDQEDFHVWITAIQEECDYILTTNYRRFPARLDRLSAFIRGSFIGIYLIWNMYLKRGKVMNEIVQKQKRYFRTGATLSLSFRLAQLARLKETIQAHEQTIIDTLAKELHKSPFEAYTTEIGIVYEEIRFVMKRLSDWMKPQRVPTPLTHFGSKSYIYPDPYGVSLIIAPWNYPFQLAISPLIGAIAAGNCAIVKPSEYTPETSSLLKTIVSEAFSEEYVAVVEGGVDVSQKLLHLPFDHIFFTGSVPVGKMVMAAAAKHLTPVTLELGGKSPAIVDASAIST